MMRFPIFAAVVVTSVVPLISGCSTHRAPAARAEATPQGPVIVRLVGRHETITVTSSPNGPLYTAQTSNGETLVANATLDELKAEHPEIYRLLEPGVAADASVEPASSSLRQ